VQLTFTNSFEGSCLLVSRAAGIEVPGGRKAGAVVGKAAGTTATISNDGGYNTGNARDAGQYVILSAQYGTKNRHVDTVR
jgi:hypothetical protein